MKNITNSFRTSLVAAASVFCAASATVQAQFIDLTANNLKVVFKTVDVVNSAGATVSATQAIASVVSTDASGTITALKQTFVEVSDGLGGLEQIVNQVTTTASVDAFSGNYSVETVTKVRTTPVNASGTATGSTTVATTVVDEADVEEADLALPPTTTFTAVSPDLDTPVVISAE